MVNENTKISLDPYLFFTGNCKEAMEFYKNIFGGELKLNMMDDGSNHVMHADLSGGEVELMASDGDRKEPYETSQVTLSLSGSDEEKLTKMFNQLSEGGTVTMALKKESWGDLYGMFTDKFGIDWMINIGNA